MDQKPELETPVITGPVTLRIQGCKKTNILMEAASIQGGILQMVASKKNNLISYGAPSQILTQIITANGTFPDSVTTSKCQFIFPRTLKPGELASAVVVKVANVFACMQELKPACSGRSYLVRMAAASTSKALYAPSKWSEPMPLNLVCEGAGTTCVW